jgi:hypothetical protein
MPDDVAITLSTFDSKRDRDAPKGARDDCLQVYPTIRTKFAGDRPH